MVVRGRARGRFPLRSAAYTGRTRHLGALTKAANSPPVNTVAPVATPSSVAVGALITSTSGTFTGTPTPSLTYQWYEGDQSGYPLSTDPIIGETALTYTPSVRPADGIAFLEVTAFNSEGSATALSNEVAVGQVIIVGQTSETTSSFAITIRRTRAVGITTETDAAQAGTKAKRKTVGQNTETDLAQPVDAPTSVAFASTIEIAQTTTARKTRAAGLTAETELAQAVTRGPRTITVGIATETSLAQTVDYPIARLIGQASETNLAQPVEGSNTRRSGAAASRPVGSRGRERARYPLRGLPYDRTGARRPWVVPQTTSSPAPLTVAIGQATETDTSLFLVPPPKTVAVTQATETDQALNAYRARRYRSGFPYPVDTVFAGPFILAGLVTETDSALTTGKRKTATLGIAVEQETAQSATVSGGSHYVSVSLAQQADTAQTVRPSKVRTLGITAETGLSQPFTEVKARTLGLVTETDSALTAPPTRVKPVAQATETDGALTATEVKGDILGIATENQTSFSPAKRKVRELGQTAETDQARPVDITGSFNVPVGTATETNTAHTPGKLKTQAVSLLQEAETAHTIQALLQHIYLDVGQAAELNLARALGRPSRARITHAATSTTSITHTSTTTRIAITAEVL